MRETRPTVFTQRIGQTGYSSESPGSMGTATEGSSTPLPPGFVTDPGLSPSRTLSQSGAGRRLLGHLAQRLDPIQRAVAQPRIVLRRDVLDLRVVAGGLEHDVADLAVRRPRSRRQDVRAVARGDDVRAAHEPHMPNRDVVARVGQPAGGAHL